VQHTREAREYQGNAGLAESFESPTEVIEERRRPGRPVSPELTARRRHEILGTAVRLFAERGYDATSLDDIARELGFTKGIVYHYFASKGALLREAVAESMETTLIRQQAIVDSALPPDAKLRRIVHDWVHDVLFDYQRYLVTLADRAVLGRTSDEAAQARPRRFVRQYRAILEEGVRAGCFRAVDPGVAAQTIVQSIQGVARWYRPDGRLSRDEICADLTDMLVASVRSDDPRR
jgi:AcrR family transcriptional regulator